MGKTGINPVFASVPFSINLCIFGVGVLNWYPNRNPSDEIRITVGQVSFLYSRPV